ncbi:flagellar type III secretion system protein FlhB [Desulfovibrio aminophilus]|nr:flagellar type III secretion system protein FlhB [Desulfovibrio aminophilus]MCM0756263.1 flagellar type III secretion system protein FlhB [Desulfovibrio aminophilus]
MPQKDPSKTEKATPKRRKKVREDGNVPKGAEMGKTMTLLAGVIALRYLVEFYYKEISNIFRWFLTGGMMQELTKTSAYELFLWGIQRMALLMLPFMLILAFVAWLTMRLQVGKLWSTKILQPKFGKVFNIFAGIQRLMLSPQAVIRFLRSMLQAAVVAIAPYIVIRQEFPNFLPLFYASPEGLAAYILGSAYKMVCYALVPMMLIAIADLWYTRWDYEEQIKMTKSEIKDEHRQAEGDPTIKLEQKQKMMNMMAKRMLADVPRADVVVTNPTHIAVALRYDAMEAPAPLVLAKGLDHLAEKIKEVAREHNIPIRENKPLAQALYKQVEIGEMIPEELYQAVAALLAGLERFKKNKR